jgi:hypothetical protein
MDELSEEAKSKQALVVARARRFRGIKTAQSRECKSGPRATTAQDFAAEARASLITLGLRYFLIRPGNSSHELWTSGSSSCPIISRSAPALFISGEQGKLKYPSLTLPLKQYSCQIQLTQTSQPEKGSRAFTLSGEACANVIKTLRTMPLTNSVLRRTV